MGQGHRGENRRDGQQQRVKKTPKRHETLCPNTQNLNETINKQRVTALGAIAKPERSEKAV
jgi:hypothetical protein